MARSQLRVVFDTNAFSALHFDAIDNSPMRSLCKSGRIVPVYCGVFMEETLRSYISPATRVDLLQRWIPFIVETVGRFCDDLPSIWHRELVQGRSREGSIFMRSANQRALIAALLNAPDHGTWSLIDETKLEREGDSARRLARRQNSLGMREELARLTRATGTKLPVGSGFVLAPAARTRLLADLGYGLIQRFISPGDWRSVGTRWFRSRDSYPYFTQFMENTLYQETLFMTDHNQGVDLNAQADLDIMTFLLDADALVTNETGFMRTAFNDIWRPRGKVLFDSSQFAAFIAHLQ